MKKLITLAIIVALAYSFFENGEFPSSLPSSVESDNRKLEDAQTRRLGDVQLTGSGTIVRILRDDLEGSRHQRFILDVGLGETVLVSHNIDLAPRVQDLKTGDQVEFAGEYEWNAKGGVVHWTHHDPAGKHPGGWIRHQGKIYQ